MKSLLIVSSTLFVLTFGLDSPALCQDTQNSQDTGNTVDYQRRWGRTNVHDRPRTGQPIVALALSGGSARGLAHIGVLQAFSETEIEIAGIAGSSMGGIIGALYSVGNSPDEIERVARQMNFSALFSNSPRRKSLFLTQREKADRTLLTLRFNSFKPSLPTELSAAQRVTELFTTLTLKENFKAGRDFSRLSIPFKTVATDISTGESITLDQGNLAEALRATMAFPLAISAVAWEDRLLMDGGMIKPAPVDLAKEFVAETPGSFTVAVNATSELLPGESIDNPFAVAVQVTSIMSMRELDEQLALADFVIDPDFNSLNGADFSRINEFVAAGRKKTEPVIEEILRLSELRSREKTVRFNSIKVLGDASVVESLIQDLEQLRERNSAITEATLDSALAARFGVGDLWELSAVLREDETALEITVAKKPEPETLKFAANPDRTETSGNRELLLESLRSRYAASDGAPFDSLVVWTEEFYDSRGIELIRFDQFSYDPLSESLTVDVNEGITNGIFVRGLERTRFSFIRDRVTFQPGQPYTVSNIEDTYRDLYGSGLFKRVSVDAAPSDTGVIVTVQVEEDNSVKLRFGYHYHDEYHNEGLLEVAEDNLFGIGLSLSASGSLADRHKTADAGVSTDRFFRTYVAAEAQIYYDEIQPDDFDDAGVVVGSHKEWRRGASFRLGQHLSRFGFMSAAVRTEEVGESFPDSPGENRYELRSLEFHSEVDDLDRTYFPRSGRRSEFLLEMFGRAFGGEVEFTRWQVSFDEYFPVTRRFNINARAFVAGSRSNLPAPEEFALGGLDSFEGFRFEELSGEKAALFNFAARWEALPNLYLSAKYNAGNVYSQTDDISFDNLRHGWAATVGLSTPLGPIVLSYGRAGEDRDRLHFHAGLNF